MQACCPEWLGRRDELRAAVVAAAAREGNAFAFVLALDSSPETALNWAGQSAGLVERSQPAAEVVREIVRDAEALLARVAGAR